LVSERQKQGVYYSREDYAGFWQRLVVDLIDFTLLLVAIVVLALIVPAGGPAFPHVLFWSTMVLGFVYLVLLKRSHFRTLGYRVGGIRIVSIQGERPSIWALTIRAMFAVFGPMNILIDILWITTDERRQALRDKFAHTYVVRAAAVPLGQGTIVYTAYSIFAVNFLFAEVRPVTGEAP
jgi:uncharacterized RDD family membrane protein YckC